MAHYPMKCVHCAKLLRNQDVLFNTANAVGGIVDLINVDAGANRIGAGNINEGMAGAGGGVADATLVDLNPDKKKSTEKKYSVAFANEMTADSLMEYCEERGLRFEKQYHHVDVTKDFEDAEGVEADDLLVGLRFQKEDGGTLLATQERLCPRCKQKLPARSGMFPTYLVSMLGSTSSGKTVYLCSLYQKLRYLELPYGTLSALADSPGTTELVSLSQRMFRDGTLPGTTQRVVSEPLVFQIKYTLKLRNGSVDKTCLFSISDMRGEDLAEEDGTTMRRRGSFLAKSDAFLTIISPMNFSSFSAALSSKADKSGAGAAGSSADDAEYNIFVHDALMGTINTYLLPQCKSGRIEAPCVITLSKTDELIRNQQVLGIHPGNAVIREDPENRYNSTYFWNLHNGTVDILKHEPQLLAFLGDTFPHSFLTAVSAIGINADIQVNATDRSKKIDQTAKLNPMRTQDPIILLLIALRFLPNYLKYEPGTPGSYNDRKNIQLFQEWLYNNT